MRSFFKSLKIPSFFFSFLFLVSFIFSSCSRYDADDNNGVNASSSDAASLLTVGEIVDIQIKIYSFQFDGTAEILSLSDDGTFEAEVDFSDFDSTQIVQGVLKDGKLSMEDFSVNHSMASGNVSDLEGEVTSSGDIEGNFIFAVTSSDYYPEAAGLKIKGSITISKRTEEESLSIAEFLAKEDFDLKITIAGFSFSGSAEINDYNSKTGELNGVFHADGLDEDIPISGKISGQTLTLDSFDIDHDYAAGPVSNIEGDFDSSTNTLKGSFSFLLEDSDLFSDYVGQSFNGEFTLSLP